MKITNQHIVIGAALVGAYVIYKAKNAANVIVDSVNPASQQNIINRVTNAGVRLASGDDDQTFGGAIFDTVQHFKCLTGLESSVACDLYLARLQRNARARDAAAEAAEAEAVANRTKGLTG